MEKLFLAAQGLDDPPSTLTLQPWDARDLGWTDGRATTFPVQVAAGLHLIQAAWDAAGTAVERVPDIDGDTWDAWIIGAPGTDTNGSASGRIYAMPGPS